MRRRDVLRLLSLSALAPAACRLGEVGADDEPDRLVAPLEDADVELLLTAAPDALPILPGDPTRVWRFSGVVEGGPGEVLDSAGDSYLGPTIRVRRGQRMRVRFRNELSEPSIVHWHGLDVPELADGHPRLAVPPSGEYVYDFTVTNRAGTYWYHPHPDMRTGPQVYGGLAGLLIVGDDEEDALELPADRSELACVIQDRTFDDGNQFAYPDPAGGGMGRRGRGGMPMGPGRGGMPMGGMGTMMGLESGVLGDRVLVNGQLDYAAEVEAGWVRLRLLNGSNARIYRLTWSDGRPMTLIGSDGGLLQRPLSQTEVVLAPAQRADLLLDLSDLGEGATTGLRSAAFPAAEAGGMGMMMVPAPGLPQGVPLEIMTLRVRGRNSRIVRLPDRLSTFDERWDPQPDAALRRVPLAFSQMRWTIDGRSFDMDGVAESETVRAGSTHVWEFVNVPNPMGMAMAHPMHLHGRPFRVVGRSGGPQDSALRPGMVDSGWTDTVLVLPGESVRTQITFGEHTGLFLYHCHILEHEDLGMMRNLRVT